MTGPNGNRYKAVIVNSDVLDIDIVTAQWNTVPNLPRLIALVRRGSPLVHMLDTAKIKHYVKKPVRGRSLFLSVCKAGALLPQGLMSSDSNASMVSRIPSWSGGVKKGGDDAHKKRSKSRTRATSISGGGSLGVVSEVTEARKVADLSDSGASDVERIQSLSPSETHDHITSGMDKRRRASQAGSDHSAASGAGGLAVDVGSGSGSLTLAPNLKGASLDTSLRRKSMNIRRRANSDALAPKPSGGVLIVDDSGA